MSLLEKLFVANRVLRGTLEVQSLTEEIEGQAAVIDRLYKVIAQVQSERQYWHDLWRAEGREYHAAQHRLIDEITNLRRKHGEANADKLRDLELLAERQRHEAVVVPPKHPVKGVQTELEHIDCPPQPFENGR